MNLGANDEAVAFFRRSIESNRANPLTHFFLATTLANLGKLEEARSEAKAGLALDPGFSIGAFATGTRTQEVSSTLCARPVCRSKPALDC